MMRPVLVALLIFAAGAPAVCAQEGPRRIPEPVEPEPHGTARTRTGGTRINFDVDPGQLPGALSVPLSEACGRLAFNQRRKGKYFVDVPRQNGPPQRFGYANGGGLNLYDPEARREPEQVYLFYRDGTSECAVYIFADGH